MKRTWLIVALVLLALAAACSPPGKANTKPGSSAGPPTATPKAVPVGGVRKMGEFVVTQAGSRVVITNWIRAAKNRPEAPGPHQVYETVGAGFCAGPDVSVTGRELTTLFSLELPDGSRVSPDNLTGKGDLRTFKTIEHGECIYAGIVFQVGGGTKPAFVVFESAPVTKWKVP